MKKITQILYLLTFTTLFSFCKTQQYTPMDFPKGQIIFGSGGGFAGTMSEFVILENGEMFSKNGIEGEYLNLKKLERNVVKQMFNNVETFNIKDVKLDQPGNMYYYIQIKDKNSDNRIVWGGGDPVPKEIKTMYNILNHYAKMKSENEDR